MTKCWPRCASANYIDGGRWCSACSPPDEYILSLITERDALRLAASAVVEVQQANLAERDALRAENERLRGLLAKEISAALKRDVEAKDKKND